MSQYVVADQTGTTSIIVVGDVCEGDTHIDTVTVTSHPVEDGIDVTDHARPEPSQLTLVLGVTQTPIEPEPDQGRGGPLTVSLDTPHFEPPFDFTPGAVWREAVGLLTAGEPTRIDVDVFGIPQPIDRIAEVEQQLITLREARVLCTVVTQSRTYVDMMITRCEMQRVNAGYATFTVDLQQIRIVSTATVAAPKPLEPRGAPMVKKGQQTPTAPKDAAAVKSALLKGLQEIGFIK